MRKLFLDFGNADIKYTDGVKTYGYFRHAIAQLSENQWRQITGRSKTPPAGYYRINGTPYAIGDTARRHTIKQRPSGASRYIETYYGIGLGRALADSFQRSSKNVTLYATHAPQDIDYVRDLEVASMRTWEVESEHGKLSFEVRNVETLDEPLGGFYHYVLTKDGKERKHNNLKTSTILVLDVGGYTVDVVAIDPGGIIDMASLASTRTGAIDLKNDFERELRSNNKTLFKEAGDLDPRRIENAILTGSYQFGNVKIDCSREALESKQTLVNDIVDIVRSVGGVGNYDIALLTGGGSALVCDELQKSIPRIDFLMVESVLEDMRYANVNGTVKIFQMLERTGAI